MKLHEYIKKMQIDSRLDVKTFSERYGFSESQFYRYTRESYMSKATPLIVSTICKKIGLSTTDLYQFEDKFSNEFIGVVNNYLSDKDYTSYIYFNIENFYNRYLKNFGYVNLILNPDISVNGEYFDVGKFDNKNNVKYPFYSDRLGMFPDAIVEDNNGKKNMVMFIPPEYIDNKTSIYDYKFKYLHFCYLWALSILNNSRVYSECNFIFLTTSEFVFDNLTDEKSMFYGLLTANNGDIYVGLCRSNRSFEFKKITNITD